MRYLILVSDYDGTLATDDRIADETALALECLRTSGRKIMLVTGRRLDSLLEVCGNQKLFDLIVVENGAVIYDPLTREKVVLANPPSQVLLQALRACGVTPLEIGQVVVATLVITNQCFKSNGAR
jgi:hydroxymethylpyrimidine pyrophosphatase-like HAD family hydrolase